MAKAKSIAEKFAALPKSRHSKLSEDQEKIIAEYVGHFLTAPEKPTVGALAALLSEELGRSFSENVLRRHIENAKRDKAKV